MKIKNILAVLLVVGSFFLPAEMDAKVTKVVLTVKPPANFKGKCPHTFEFSAEITSDSAGVVEYRWLRSDKTLTPTKTLTFKSPGTMVVTTWWKINEDFKGWQAVSILSPNTEKSNLCEIEVECVNDGT
jgi:hypothetical protein